MGVTSVLTLHWSCLFIDNFRLWPHCRLFIFTPFSYGKWLSYSLSPAQTSSTQISLIAFRHPEYTPWPFAKGLTFFLINDNPFVYIFALGPYNLLPLWHITMSLPQKDSCLDMLCLLWVSESTFSRPIARLTQYPLASRLTFWLRRIYLNTCHRFELKVTQDLIPLTTMHSHSMLTLPPSDFHHSDNQIVAHWSIASLISNYILPKIESLNSYLPIALMPLKPIALLWRLRPIIRLKIASYSLLASSLWRRGRSRLEVVTASWWR